MRVRALFLTLLFLAGCATAPPAAGRLRVMTFNIRLDLASDGPNAWPNRAVAVAGIMDDSGADLVGVQEALPGQLRDLDALLPSLARFGHGRAADLGGEHSAIFYRTARLEMLEHDTFWLSETPKVAGSKGWDAAYERIVTWGKLRDRQTGVIFFHFNTHFDHVGEVARAESARLLLRKIEQIAGSDTPVLLTGDFNATPDSEPVRVITSEGLQDAISRSRAPHRGPMSTWNGFKMIEPGRRIDFIFTTGEVEVLEHAILADTVDGRFPSDHLPVVATVVLPESPKS